MSPIQIFPRFKLVLTYDVRPEALGIYQHFVINELVPTLQDVSLYLLAVWETAYGPYPERQVEFVAESLVEVLAALKDDRWALLEGDLLNFVHNYHRTIIPFRQGFQLVAGPTR